MLISMLISVFHYMRKVKDVQSSLIQTLTLEPKPLTLLHSSPSLLSTQWKKPFLTFSHILEKTIISQIEKNLSKKKLLRKKDTLSIQTNLILDKDSFSVVGPMKRAPIHFTLLVGEGNQLTWKFHFGWKLAKNSTISTLTCLWPPWRFSIEISSTFILAKTQNLWYVHHTLPWMKLWLYYPPIKNKK